MALETLSKFNLSFPFLLNPDVQISASVSTSALNRRLGYELPLSEIKRNISSVIGQMKRVYPYSALYFKDFNTNPYEPKTNPVTLALFESEYPRFDGKVDYHKAEVFSPANLKFQVFFPFPSDEDQVGKMCEVFKRGLGHNLSIHCPSFDFFNRGVSFE
jgi:hypothetical protein